jgi:hypothetical protein
LVEAGRAADAERVYREDLADHPRSGWSLLGLQQALKTHQKPSTEVDADLSASCGADRFQIAGLPIRRFRRDLSADFADFADFAGA